jgi:hypothetical protein
MTLLKEPDFYRKDAKKFKTKLNISYELACALVALAEKRQVVTTNPSSNDA